MKAGESDSKNESPKSGNDDKGAAIDNVNGERGSHDFYPSIYGDDGLYSDSIAPPLLPSPTQGRAARMERSPS